MAQNAYWEPFLNNFGGNQNYTEFSSGPFVANSSSDTLFINKFGAIVRTSNGGKSWELIAGEWDSGDTGLATLFYADPYFDRLWSGGITGISQMYLWKSIDYENNKWANVSEGLSDNAEATPYDIMTDPKDKDLVLIGLGGAFEASNNVKKSTNGGQGWQNVLDSTGVHTFARDKKNTDLIYASGRDTSGKLFYVTTADFGESWEKNIFVESSSPITTNDLAVMIINGKKMLFLGTDHGLFSYTFPD